MQLANFYGPKLRRPPHGAAPPRRGLCRAWAHRDPRGPRAAARIEVPSGRGAAHHPACTADPRYRRLPIGRPLPGQKAHGRPGARPHRGLRPAHAARAGPWAARPRRVQLRDQPRAGGPAARAAAAPAGPGASCRRRPLNARLAAEFDMVVCSTAFAQAEFDPDRGAGDARAVRRRPRHLQPPAPGPPPTARAGAGRRAADGALRPALAGETPGRSIETAAVLHAAGMRVRLVVAGDGPMRRVLERRARHLPVTFVGFLGGAPTSPACSAIAGRRDRSRPARDVRPGCARGARLRDARRGVPVVCPGRDRPAGVWSRGDRRLRVVRPGRPPPQPGRPPRRAWRRRASGRNSSTGRRRWIGWPLHSPGADDVRSRSADTTGVVRSPPSPARKPAWPTGASSTPVVKDRANIIDTPRRGLGDRTLAPPTSPARATLRPLSVQIHPLNTDGASRQQIHAPFTH